MNLITNPRLYGYDKSGRNMFKAAAALPKILGAKT